jgi:HK97 family phage portal protein
VNVTKALTAPFRGAASGLKGLTGWTRGSRSWLFSPWGFLLPRTKYDYGADIGDGTGSSIIVAIINWIARTFPEAPVMVVDRRYQRVEDHPLPELIERPNPYYSGPLLWMPTIVDLETSGNGYWIKVRSEAGKVVELWWAPSWTMEPKWERDGGEFITHYEYRPGGTGGKDIAPRDVVHFRYGLDPDNTRKGLSPLRSLLREIWTDDEAANFTAQLMHHLGIPGLIISPESATGYASKEVAEEVKQEAETKFGGDNRGRTMVMRAPTKVQILSFSPEQMNLRDLRRVPEERASAVLGVPAVVVGLGAGLDRSTFTNMAEAREAAYEGKMIPTQRLLAADLRNQLLPDFTSDKSLKVEFDLTRVRVLQEDQQKLAERGRIIVTGMFGTVGDARRLLGLPTGPEHEIYLRMVTIMEVPAKGTKGGGGIGVKSAPALAFNAAMNEARVRLAQRFEPEMGRFFKGQAKRVRQRLGTMINLRGQNGARFKANITAPGLLPEEEDALLAEALVPLWAAGAEIGWMVASEAFALEVAFDLANPLLVAALAEGVFRARRINDGTRKSIEEAVQQAQTSGYNAQQLVFGVPDDGFAGLLDRVEATYENRPAIISANEATWGTNQGTGGAYRQAGFQRVQLVDMGDDPPCMGRNGLIVSVQAAMGGMGEHVHGSLTFVPL